jgi:DNA-binding IclR family transcriptional regulator
MKDTAPSRKKVGRPRSAGASAGRGAASTPARGTEDTLKSLGKIVRILDCFSTTDRTLSVAEVSQKTALPRSTAHRLLASLKEVGLLDQDRQRDHYRLGLKLFELGNIVLANMDLHREARPYVEQLGRLTGHVVHLAVFDGRRAIVIHRSDPTDSASPLTFVESAPVHCTGVGKAILAYQPVAVVERLVAEGLRAFTDTTITSEPALRAELERTRDRGYAVDESEHQPGVRCVGAPIRDHDGRVFAAVSVTGSAWKISAAETEALAKVVMHTARSISDRL